MYKFKVIASYLQVNLKQCYTHDILSKAFGFGTIPIIFILDKHF